MSAEVNPSTEISHGVDVSTEKTMYPGETPPSYGSLFEDSDDDMCSATFNQESWEKNMRAKQEYVRKIRWLCGKDDGCKDPLNIAIIGSYGVGKSSLINTIATAFSEDRWHEHAQCGAYGGAGTPMSVYVESFRKCCHPNDKQYKKVLLPTLIDIAGFPDEHTDKWEELLRIVLYGRLQEGEAILSAYQYGEKYGVEGLRKKYSARKESLKVHRIIFVAAADQPVPKNLIKCMLKAAKPSGQMTDRGSRAIPIFGVLTKSDKVKKVSRREAEDELMSCLGLTGNKSRFLACKNYCDAVDPGGRRTNDIIPELDVPVLKLMYQVVDDSRTVHNSEESYTDTVQDESITTTQTPNNPQPQDRKHQNNDPPGENRIHLPDYIWNIRRVVALLIETISFAIMLYFINDQIDHYSKIYRYPSYQIILKPAFFFVVMKVMV